MKNFINQLILLLFAIAIFSSCSEPESQSTKTPNIIIIYADDLGFGDLSSYGATEISTANIDRIAKEGIKFTNGYASSATCTPSRYALLTGEYPWRNTRAKILPGDAPLLIDPSKPTLPSILKKANYATAIIGKWHLGLGGKNRDWNEEITPGPNEIGFDYSYIMASTNDRVPSVYVENNKVAGLSANDPLEVNYKENFSGEPTGRDNPELLKMHPSNGHDMSIHNGISRIGFMRGGKSALWVDEDMADNLLNRSLNYIKDNKEKPFFLFYSLHQPHVPRTPHPRFAGTSGMGPRGDVILEIDYAVGELLDLLDSLALTENTIVVFSSDNGPVLDDGYQDDAVTKIGNHTPAGILRGGKYSLFDAGTHVPFMVRWPGTITAGTSDALVCQIDFAASFAALTNQKNTTPDSENVLDALLGKSATGRKNLVLEAIGSTFYREEQWVMIPPSKGTALIKSVNIETGKAAEYQLYNLAEDPSQQNNLSKKEPEKLQQMITDYEAFISI